VEPASTRDVTPLEIIRQARFFRGLSAPQLDAIAQISRVQGCEKGGQVYNIGEPAQSFYVLVSGSIRLAIGSGQHNTSAGDILRRGDVFGWAALTPSSNHRIATAACLTDCRFIAVDGARLLALMESDTALGYRIMVELTALITGTVTAFVAG
jgi:CRP-like cAMP-binding protein